MVGQRPSGQRPVPSCNIDCCRELWDYSLQWLWTQPARGQLHKHLKGKLKHAHPPNFALSIHTASWWCPPHVSKQLSLAYLH